MNVSHDKKKKKKKKHKIDIIECINKMILNLPNVNFVTMIPYVFFLFYFIF